MYKINLWQYVPLLIVIMVSSFLGIGIYSIVQCSKVDAWVSLLLGGLFGFIILFLFIKVANYEPSLPLNKKINKLFGNKIGCIINLIIILVYLIDLVSLIYNLTSFISSQFLSETPSLLIGFVFICIIIYINIKGIEVISRVGFILIIINIILYIISILGTIPTFELSNIKPILENGLLPSLKGSIYVVFVNVLSIAPLLMIPKNNITNNRNFNKVIITSYIAGIIIMFFVIFVTIGNLGIDLTSIYQYPEYVVLKRVKLFAFIDRVENVMVIQWIFGIFTTISILVYSVSNTIKTNTKNKWLIGLVSFSTLLISNQIFKNNTIYNEYVLKYALFFKYAFLLIIVIIFIASRFRKKE